MAVDAVQVPLVQFGPGLAVVGGAHAQLFQDRGHRVVEGQRFERRADIPQLVGKGKAAQLAHRAVQRIQEKQQEAHLRRHRTRDIAHRHDARLVAPALLVRQRERHAVVAGVGTQRAAQVELAAQLHALAAGVARGQLARHARHRRLHALHVLRRHASERALHHELAHEGFGGRAAEELEALIDERARFALQRVARRLQRLRLGLRAG